MQISYQTKVQVNSFLANKTLNKNVSGYQYVKEILYIILEHYKTYKTFKSIKLTNIHKMYYNNIAYSTFIANLKKALAPAYPYTNTSLALALLEDELLTSLIPPDIEYTEEDEDY